MNMPTTLHLLKSSDNNYHKLLHIPSQSDTDNEPYLITTIKTQIINKLVIPISKDNFDIIIDNMYLISFYKDRIQQFMRIYKTKYELQTYKYILDVINYAVVYHRIILASRKNNLKNKDFAIVSKQLGIVGIKAEYILYNAILGKPNKKKGEKYNDQILIDIRLLLNSLDIDFYKINKIIKEKYN